MIQSFRDRATEDVFNDVSSKTARKACPVDIWKVARRKLTQLNNAVSLPSLAIPPGNELEALTRDRKGQHSIRINDQYRVCLIPTHGPPTHPGEMLNEEFVKPLGITQMKLAAALGLSFQSVNAILNCRRSVTPDVALRLERLFGMEAQFWLNLQMGWDLYHEIHGPKAKERAKIKRHRALVRA